MSFIKAMTSILEALGAYRQLSRTLKTVSRRLHSHLQLGVTYPGLSPLTLIARVADSGFSAWPLHILIVAMARSGIPWKRAICHLACSLSQLFLGGWIWRPRSGVGENCTPNLARMGTRLISEAKLAAAYWYLRHRDWYLRHSNFLPVHRIPTSRGIIRGVHRSVRFTFYLQDFTPLNNIELYDKGL
jgi:hypothetical protein